MRALSRLFQPTANSLDRNAGRERQSVSGSSGIAAGGRTARYRAFPMVTSGRAGGQGRDEASPRTRRAPLPANPTSAERRRPADCVGFAGQDRRRRGCVGQRADRSGWLAANPASALVHADVRRGGAHRLRLLARLPRLWRGSGPSRSAAAQELIEVQGRVHRFEELISDLLSALLMGDGREYARRRVSCRFSQISLQGDPRLFGYFNGFWLPSDRSTTDAERVGDPN